MTKPIFVATDFSKIAQQATAYAIELAKKLNADIYLLHSYNIPYVTSENPISIIGVNELRDIAEAHLQNELHRINQIDDTISVKTHLLIGDLVEGINEIAENLPPSVVVIGKSGNNEDFLWGSTAINVLRNVKYPVLAIPKGAVWNDVKQMCLTTDYTNIQDTKVMDKLKFWKDLMKADLHVLHIDKPDKHTPLPEDAEKLLLPFNPQYHNIQKENMDDGISHYLSENAADWLVVIPKKYGFFEKLFHTSKSKLIVQSSPVPTLALHSGV